MLFQLRLSYLVGSISVVTFTVGLAFSQLTTQKLLAQTVTPINGAGTTITNVLYKGQGGWFNTYGRARPPTANPPGPISLNVQFRYAGVGSRTGTESFLTQTPPPLGLPSVPRPIAFGASDVPLEPEQRTVSGGPNSGPLIQVPVIGIGITLAYNPQDLGVPERGLRLSRATYCGILNGNIRNWSDGRIAADNGKQLNNLRIRVVRRADSGGSTFLLTNHLETVCKSPSNWNRGVGIAPETDNSTPDNDSATISWPVSFRKGNGDSGVAAAIERTPGGFGYVGNSTRQGQRIPAASLENKAGNFVGPEPGSVSIPFCDAEDQDPDPRIISVTVPDPQQQTAYPIVGVSYHLYYGKYANSSVAAGIKGFITDFVADPTPSSKPQLNADTIAIKRGYAPLCAGLKAPVRAVVNSYLNTDQKSVPK